MNYNFTNTAAGDGVQICTIKAQGFKTACASVSFAVPLGADASGFALAAYMLTHSSAKYPTFRLLEKKLASLYGAGIGVDISKSGESQVIELYITCIDDRFALEGESIVGNCCELLFDIIFDPNVTDGKFGAEETETEKRILCEQLAAEMSDKRFYARTRCEEIMCADEPYGINRFGTKEDILKLDPESLYSAYKKLLETSFITLGVSGGSDFEEIKNMFLARLAGVKRAPVLSQAVFKQKADEVKYVKETEPVKQGKLVMGFRLGMADEEDMYAARRVMADLFGGSPHSKLFTVVREKMSLCYMCSARMFRRKGIMFVQSGIETDNEQKAKDAILAQLKAIENGDFTQDDLDYSIKGLEDSFKSVTDTPEALASWFTSQSLSGKYYYPEDYIAMFKAVTKEQVMQAAAAVTLDTVFMLAGDMTDAGEEEEAE